METINIQPFAKQAAILIPNPVEAFIDMGTNSFHLIVFRSKYNSYEIIETVKEFTPFFSRCLNEHFINSQGLKSTVNTMEKLCTIARSHNAASITAVATSAIRESKNGEEVLEILRKNLKIDAKMISGKEEARLIYLGVSWNMPKLKNKFCIIDIGGGSNEIIMADKNDIYFAESYKLGCARLTQKYFPDEEFKPAKIFELHKHIKGMLEPACNRLMKSGFNPKSHILIGSSGTFQALAKLNFLNKKIENLEYHGSVHTLEELDNIRKFIEQWAQKGKKIKGINPQRNKTILAGAIVATEFMKCLEVDSVMISSSALREGLTVDSLIRKNLITNSFGNFINYRQKSVFDLLKRFNGDLAHSEQVANIAVTIFRNIQGELHNLNSDYEHLLWASAILHDIGTFISRNGHHKHSYHLIRYSGLLSHSEEEIELIANIARYHRGSLPKETHQFYRNLSIHDSNVVLVLSAILRMAEALDRSHKQIIEKIKILPNKSITHSDRPVYGVYIVAKANSLIESEIWAFKEKQEYFEKVLKARFDLILDVSGD